MRQVLSLSQYNFVSLNGDDFFFESEKNIVSSLFFVKEINRLDNTYDIEVIYIMYNKPTGEEVYISEMVEFLEANIQLDEVGFYVIEELDASLNRKGFLESIIRRALLKEIES